MCLVSIITYPKNLLQRPKPKSKTPRCRGLSPPTLRLLIMVSLADAGTEERKSSTAILYTCQIRRWNAEEGNLLSNFIFFWFIFSFAYVALFFSWFDIDGAKESKTKRWTTVCLRSGNYRQTSVWSPYVQIDLAYFHWPCSCKLLSPLFKGSNFSAPASCVCVIF